MRIRTTLFCGELEKFDMPDFDVRMPDDDTFFDVSVEMKKTMLWDPRTGQWGERNSLKFVESMEKGEMR